MKAISLLQPWASFVVKGLKRFETRTWDTKYRGLLLIHASKGKSEPSRMLCKMGTDAHLIEDYNTLPFGAIIGAVELVETYKTDFILEKCMISDYNPPQSLEAQLGDYSPNRFGWYLKNPIVFDKPIPLKGNLGIWNVPKE
jgi:activating signal cointegrator 1